MENYKPTDQMISNAKRGLEMRESQPDSNKCCEEEGIARARDISNGKNLSKDTVKRMYSFFSRHEVDKDTESWKEGNSKGEQSWLMWGGDAGYEWSKKIVKTFNDKKDAYGFQILEDVKITKTGFYEYPSSVVNDYKGDDDYVVIERTKESLKNKDFLNSLDGAIVIEDHDGSVLLDINNIKNYDKKGFVFDPYFDEGDGYVKGKMKIIDKSIISKIKNKEKNELSMGSNADIVYDETKNRYVFDNVIANHVAIVEKGRVSGTGITINDAIKVNVMDKKEEMNDKKEEMKQDVSLDKEVLKKVDKLIAMIEKMMSSKVNDKEEEEKKEKEKAINDSVDERVNIILHSKEIIGDFKHESMSNNDILNKVNDALLKEGISVTINDSSSLRNFINLKKYFNEQSQDYKTSISKPKNKNSEIDDYNYLKSLGA